MINNVVLVSHVQQSDSVIYTHVFILFQILFPFRLLQNTEQSSLCYTVGPCWLSIFFLIILFYLFLAALGLGCCMWAFGERGLLFVAVRGLLIVVASLVAEHRH